MKAQKSRSGWLRHWPMITIVLAVIAMLVAVVIMVLPQDDKHDKKNRLLPPPAPDRMNTDPLGRQSQVDPWGDPNGPPPSQQAPDPGDQALNGGRPTPDPPKPPPPPDPDDIYGGLSGGGSTGGVLGGSTGGGFMIAMVDHACKKLKSCPTTGGSPSTIAAVCDQIGMMPMPPMPSSSACPHAQKCFDAIDKLDCNANIDDPFAAVGLIQDCSKAATDC